MVLRTEGDRRASAQTGRDRGAVPAAGSARGRGTPRRRGYVRTHPHTVAAVVVLAAALVAAAVVARTSASSSVAAGDVAATVGSQVVTTSEVGREVAAIDAEPAYRASLAAGSTEALAAPVTPSAVASTNGDPDDLRISLAPAGSAQRPYTAVDLQAGVLTRLLYVRALGQVLAARHLTPTGAELADGASEARLDAGLSATGASLFASLPGWYQAELTRRGAEVEALTSSLAGPGAVTEADIDAAYARQAPTAYTEVCLRSVVLPAGERAAGPADLAAGAGVRDDGCALLDDWAADVAAAVRSVPAGAPTVAVTRGGQVAVVEVTRRTTLPEAAAAAAIRASLSAGSTDLVNTVVEDQLALDHVTVAPRYGTYESMGDVHGVLPPDALTPPQTGVGPSGPAPTPRQRPDPFD